MTTRSLAVCIFLYVTCSRAVCGYEVAFWDFSAGLQGWIPNSNITAPVIDSEGITFDVIAEDPYLTSPLTTFPTDHNLTITIRMRSTGEADGEVFYGQTFSGDRRIPFNINPDGDWHEYQLDLPILGDPSRLRLDPSQQSGTITLAWIRVDTREQFLTKLTLENSLVKVELDLTSGGAIGYLSEAGSTRNLVNIHDRGRFIQQSYYAGQPLDRRSEGQHPSWSPWAWNPIQVGDAYLNSGEVLDATVTADGIAYTKTHPLLWDMNNEFAECHFETWVELQGAAVHVRNRLTCFRTDDLWPVRAAHQELPAVYTIGDLYNLYTYIGDSPWTMAPVTRVANNGPPWEYWPSANFPGQHEKWGALVDDSEWGVGCYNAGTQLFVGGFHGSPGGGPYDGSTGYLSPLRTESLRKDSVYEYDYYLIVGTLTEIREFVYQKEGLIESPRSLIRMR